MSRGRRALLSVAILAGCQETTVEVDPSVPVLEIALTGELVLDTTPLATIGGGRSDPEHALYLIQDARFLPTGGVALAEESSQSVLLFDSLGTFRMSLGRGGGGPGEFERVRSVHPLGGDTIAVWDAVVDRITIFTPDKPPETADLRTAADPHGLRESARYEPLDLHTLAADRFVVVHQDGFHNPRGRSRWPTFISVVNTKGEYTAHIGARDGAEWFRGVQFPLARGFHGAAAGEMFYTGDGVQDLIAFDASGAAVHRLRLPLPRQFVSDAERDAIVDSYLDLTSNASDRQSVADILADAPFPDSTPAYTGVRASRDNRLWVRAYSRPGEDPRRWLIVDPAAGTATALAIPRRYVVEDATANRILVRTRDAQDREAYLIFGYGPADSSAR